MIEVAKRLWIQPGPPPELLLKALANSPNWAIVHAAREPWWTKLKLKKTDADYIVAIRGNECFMNIVDVQDITFYSHLLLDPALEFMQKNYDAGKNVLCHCNMGVHRSPTIMLLFMAMNKLLPKEAVNATQMFKHMYPYFQELDFNTYIGIYAYISAHWSEYVKGGDVI